MGWPVLGAGLIWGWQQGGRRALLAGLLWGLGMVALGLALYLPFYRHYQAQGLGVGWVSAAARSPLANWIEIWGLFMLAAVVLLALAWRGALASPATERSARSR